MKQPSKLQAEDDKVADALRHSWVYHLPKELWPFAQLARWERPIGWQLLMWPCWWSAMLAVIAAQDVRLFTTWTGNAGSYPVIFKNSCRFL